MTLPDEWHTAFKYSSRQPRRRSVVFDDRLRNGGKTKMIKRHLVLDAINIQALE